MIRGATTLLLPMLALAVALSGCREPSFTTDTTLNEAAIQTSAASPAAGARYRCTDGRTVRAEFLDAQNLTLHLGDRDVLMQAAVSTKGARFVGGGWQWWVADLADTTLRPLRSGETIATRGGVTCKVE